MNGTIAPLSLIEADYVQYSTRTAGQREDYRNVIIYLFIFSHKIHDTSTFPRKIQNTDHIIIFKMYFS